MNREPSPSEQRFDALRLAALVHGIDRRVRLDRELLLEELIWSGWPSLRALCQ
jgi:hypothetical protein